MKPFLSDMLFKYIQGRFFKKSKPNTFEPKTESVDTILENGVRFRNEIKYSDRYPNSFFDIYYGGEDITKKRPTLINLHGGGFFMGSRVYGDPLANMEKLGATVLSEIAAKGFNAVLPDYCLSPQHRYPEQVYQINEFLKYLIESGDSLGLDTENIILMGDSAGAVLAAIYATAVSNPQYAGEIGLEPCAGTDRIKFVIIDDAPLDVKKMNSVVRAMYKSWFGFINIKNSRQAKQLLCKNRVTPEFPPSFITAGNDGGFPEDMKELYEALVAAGAKTEYYYVDPAVAKEPHGYLSNYKTDDYAAEAVEKMLNSAKQFTYDAE